MFSPDGALIAFQRAREGSGNTYDIQVMNAGRLRRASGDRERGEPAWQPVANRAPDCSPVRATPASLCAPNHRFLTVTISGATDPDGDAVDLEITGVTQDEPVPARRPDLADATAQPDGALRLRAERRPRATGASTGSRSRCPTAAAAPARVGDRPASAQERRSRAVDSAPPSYDSFARRTRVPGMFVDVRLFAMLRERAGSESVTVELRDGATVREAVAAVAHAHDLGDLVARMPVVMAVNREYADDDSVLAEGDELALIPPVSGGATADRAPPASSPARATSSSWSWSATTLPSGRTTSSCSACARCTPSPATSASSSARRSSS